MTVLCIVAPHVLRLVKGNSEKVMLDSESLDGTDTVKTLGVFLDSDISFTDHVTSVYQRAMER
ncbi:hypothetical protein J6590_038791 [Homalodisca vitripennis]|nr:hypothetical protein J6590_038791 [Homalodisca vitripennis]